METARGADAAGEVGGARRLDGLDRAAAARALDDADDRQAEFARHLFRHQRLGGDRGVGRAAADGEIVADDHDRPAVDQPAAEHAIRRRERGEVAGGIVLGLAGDGADLVEASRIDEERNALAHRQPATIVLALDLVGAAHLAREAFAAHQLIEFGLPVHAAPPGAAPLFDCSYIRAMDYLL